MIIVNSRPRDGHHVNTDFPSSVRPSNTIIFIGTIWACVPLALDTHKQLSCLDFCDSNRTIKTYEMDLI